MRLTVKTSKSRTASKSITKVRVCGTAALSIVVSDVHSSHAVELGVVIGEGGRDITASSAMRHVAGYTLAVDYTGRNMQNKGESLAGSLHSPRLGSARSRATDVAGSTIAHWQDSRAEAHNCSQPRRRGSRGRQPKAWTHGVLCLHSSRRQLSRILTTSSCGTKSTANTDKTGLRP